MSTLDINGLEDDYVHKVYSVDQLKNDRDRLRAELRQAYKDEDEDTVLHCIRNLTIIGKRLMEKSVLY